MFRGTISNINYLSNQRFKLVRKICISSCVAHKKPTAAEVAERKQRDEEMRWTTFYHFTNMKYHSIVTRLKIYPLITTVVASPVAFLLKQLEVIDDFLPCLVIGITGTIPLTLYSAALANTIGIIYICKENKNLQIGYIDFLGRQQFKEMTVEELRKCEKSPVKFGLYKNVTVMDGNEQKLLKIPWNTGEIYNSKLFRRAFGK